MSNVSKVELEFNEFIKSLGYPYERNNRRILKKIVGNEYAELDFWFPEQRIGIEFDGDYYHNNGTYNTNEFVMACWSESFIYPLLKCHRNNPKAVIKFAYSYKAKIFIYHIYEFEWTDKEIKEKVKQDIKNILENKQTLKTDKNRIIIDAGKDNYLSLISEGYVIKKYNNPEIIKHKGKLKIYNCGTLTMEKNELPKK